jgi:membrane fusion protein, multidrug efflux system
MRVTRWAVAALALAATACAGSAGEEPRSDSDTSSTRVVNVEVLAVAPESFEDQVSITGTVEANRDVTVAAEESGVVRVVYAEKGNRVRAGQPLVKIDDEIVRAQHDQARAEAALARETYERQRRLWEEEKIGSELTFLQAKYRAETAEASVRVLAARLERTVVRAPIAGVLESRAVEVGSMVGPGAPVARIIDVDTLKVAGGVPERYAGEVKRGAGAIVNFETLGRDFQGRTRFVGTAVNEQNRTFPVEIAIPNAGGTLKPGMVARVRLARGAQRQAILVPREAVLRTETGYAVFTVQEEGGRTVAQMTPVITGAGNANRVVIESGLSVKDQVVVVGQHQVAHGDVVQIVARGGAQS